MLTVVFFINIIRLYLFNHQKKCRTVIIKVKVTEAFKCKIYQKIVHFATKCVAELLEESESLSKSELIQPRSPMNVDNARPFPFSIWIIFKVTISRHLGSPVLRELKFQSPIIQTLDKICVPDLQDRYTTLKPFIFG